MSSSCTFYLEQYLDSLGSLPAELRRNFTLMHDLDNKNKSILQEVDGASDEYLRKVRELGPDQRRKEMEKIQKMFHRAKQNGDDKVSIAIQTYELVDKHIRKLDSDLAKFEAEMKEKGRLSQTETEEEEEVGKARKGSNKKAAKAASKKKTKKDGSSAAADKPKKGQKAGASPGMLQGVPPLTLPPGGGLPVPQEVLDMPVDPNEPTYCICNQVSYGEMVGCDNDFCTIEWFHFGCMNLTSKPKGKWYCPQCITQFKKKK